MNQDIYVVRICSPNSDSNSNSTGACTAKRAMTRMHWQLHTSNSFGRNELSSITSTPYIALDIGFCISGCTAAAASKTDRNICLTLWWISNHLTANRQANALTTISVFLSLKEWINSDRRDVTLMLLFKFPDKFWCILVIQCSAIVLQSHSDKHAQ